MAREITVTTTLQVQNANLAFTASAGSYSVDQATMGGPSPAYMEIGTSEENTTFPELTTEGFLYMRNLDATNYVEWGFSTGVYGGKMKAGETALYRLKPGTTLYLKANTAACKCVIYALED